jgi:hypothetical protein
LFFSEPCVLVTSYYPAEGKPVKPGDFGALGGGRVEFEVSVSQIPATAIFVPQQAHRPIIARLPLRIKVRVGEHISCFVLHRTQ